MSVSRCLSLESIVFCFVCESLWRVSSPSVTPDGKSQQAASLHCFISWTSAPGRGHPTGGREGPQLTRHRSRRVWVRVSRCWGGDKEGVCTWDKTGRWRSPSRPSGRAGRRPRPCPQPRLPDQLRGRTLVKYPDEGVARRDGPLWMNEARWSIFPARARLPDNL